jgi:predicted kinase
VPEPMLVVISGPIASGKSTVAQALARQLERIGGRVVVIDLDLVHDSLQHPAGGPEDHAAAWSLARHAAAAAANQLLEEGVGVVIAEGSFNESSQRSDFVERLTTGLAPIYVTLLVSYEEALRRAQRDPTRGVSRDPSFLRQYYARVSPALASLPGTDIVIDTELLTDEATASAVANRIRIGWPNY